MMNRPETKDWLPMGGEGRERKERRNKTMVAGMDEEGGTLL